MHNHPRTTRLYGLGESELRHVRSRWVSRFKWGKNTKGRTTLLCVRTSPQYDNEAVMTATLIKRCQDPTHLSLMSLIKKMEKNRAKHMSTSLDLPHGDGR